MPPLNATVRPHRRLSRRSWLATAGLATAGLGAGSAFLPPLRATPVPGASWRQTPPQKRDRLVDAAALEQLAASLELPGRGSGLLVARAGQLVFDARRQPRADAGTPLTLPLHSVAKSLWANLLGVALARGVLAHERLRIVEALPELADIVEVPPVPGADFPTLASRSLDAHLLHIASHTDGLFRDHGPGEKFTYGSANYCALLRATARAWNHGHDELGLIQRELLDPIGARATGRHSRQAGMLDSVARLADDFLRLEMTPEDLLRLGWLWRCKGLWGHRQVIPLAWMRRSTEVAREIVENLPRRHHLYGYGFWSNSEGQLWPGLPKDAFASQGFAGLRIFACGSADLAAVAWGRVDGAKFVDQVRDARPWQELLTALR